MSLSQEERKAVVDYRLEKAESTFDEAQKVSTLDLWNNAANRLYYSLYYAATALLIADQHQCHTHSGMLTLMNMHYVKTGKLSAEDGRLLRRLFTLRHEGDYEDFVEVTKEEILQATPEVRALLDKLKHLLPSSL